MVCFSLLDADEGVDHLGIVFGSVLTETSYGWPYLAPALANFAFFSGLLLSWKPGKDSSATTCRTDSPELAFSRCLVGAALRQGYTRRFAWPPQPAPSPVDVVSSIGIERNATAGLSGHVLLANEQLTRRVRPIATTLLGFPVLVVLMVLFADGMGSLLGMLGPRLYRTATGRLVCRLAGAILSGLAWVHSMWKAAGRKLRVAAIRTTMPVVCGAIAIVTTTMGVVLYGVAHVGLDTLAESGVFGLNETAMATLLELIDLQWRFLQEINWSWWVLAMEERHRRAEKRVLVRYHCDCYGHACPFLGYGEGKSPVGPVAHATHGHGLFRLHHSAVGGVEEEKREDERGAVHIHHIHYHHHHQYCDEGEKPGFRQRWFWWWIFMRRRHKLLGDKMERSVPVTRELHQRGQLEAKAREIFFL